ncbi:MAG: endonuclease [Gemmatimonadetes bacterium]|nr:endonuclease [Gemmatimonadota bacterium]
MIRYRVALLLVTAAALPGCARTINLEDPAGPRFGTAGRTERTALADSTPGQITVVTFNVMYGRAIDRAIEVLRTPPLRGADIISLQEVNAAGVARIARALEMEYVYYPAAIHPVEDTEFGAALLSAWPIERDWKLILPHRSFPRRQQRGASAAVLRLGEMRVRVYAVHAELGTGITPWQREDQANRLVCDAWNASEPVVIAGDFNGSDVVLPMNGAGYGWANRDAGPSALFLHLDHIFVRGLEPASSGTVAYVHGASDHRPVWATLRLQAAGAPAAAPVKPRVCS